MKDSSTEVGTKSITLDKLIGAIFSATDENGYAQELGMAIWSQI